MGPLVKAALTDVGSGMLHGTPPPRPQAPVYLPGLKLL